MMLGLNVLSVVPSLGTHYAEAWMAIPDSILLESTDKNVWREGATSHAWSSQRPRPRR